ncbi:MAG: carbon-nitrogen hydrolase family protein [Desulfobacula sp.]|nr:carbon-nitrogen hydrolase family protein [Desulfobacula sp.]
MTCEKIAVAGIQLSQVMGNRDANISEAIKAITKNPGHDIYVLPELSSSGYGIKVFQALEDLSEDVMGHSFKAFSDLAKRQKCFICYSFPKRVGNRKFTISTSVVDKNGSLVANYDKWHVCSTGVCCEKDYFSAGNKPLAAFDVNGIKVGLAICYDIRFPELARKLTMENHISLLLHPGGWPRDEGFHTWHTFIQVRAIENSIYIMSTNWAGPDNGCTAFCPPFIDGDKHKLKKLGSAPGLLKGIVDIDFLKKVRRKCPYLADRNVDMYGNYGFKNL